MHLYFRNVNDAFRGLVELFHNGWHNNETDDTEFPVKSPSRNGNVLVIEEPVTITYSHPRERVLFNAARDANPFFHVYESLWMLAGRNDVDAVAYYAKQMWEYSDDGTTLNGAYGYRWRAADGGTFPHPNIEQPGDDRVGSVWAKMAPTDQLEILINHLKADPTSRRAVLQMWNVEDDLLKIGKGAPAYSKDVCCNLSVMFLIRTESARDEGYQGPPDTYGMKITPYLDMTVINRSNDLVWGSLGANVVHFSFLQEYVAAALGVQVGRYHQFSNNLHAYEWNWKPDEWLADTTVDHYTGNSPNGSWPLAGPDGIGSFPLVRDRAAFDHEVKDFVEYHKDDRMFSCGQVVRWAEPFLNEVAQPLCLAWHAHKRKTGTADQWASKCLAADWRLAALAWLQRRRKETT